jgi:hypothetical protein
MANDWQSLCYGETLICTNPCRPATRRGQQGDETKDFCAALYRGKIKSRADYKRERRIIMSDEKDGKAMNRQYGKEANNDLR